MTNPIDVSRLHAQAFQDLLNATLEVEQAGGAYEVFVGEVTVAESAIAYPYLVVWPSPATRPVNVLNGYDGAAISTTQITAAGTSVDEVLAAMDRVAAALHRRIPTVPGRLCGPITQVPGVTPPQPSRDDKVHTSDGRPVFFTYLLFTLYSTTGGTP